MRPAGFRRLKSLLQNGVVKGGDAPDALILDQHTNAQFHRTVTSRVSSAALRPLVWKIAVNPFSISAIPFIDSPRTVTSWASGVQNQLRKSSLMPSQPSLAFAELRPGRLALPLIESTSRRRLPRRGPR